jgi:hypothetical protein
LGERLTAAGYELVDDDTSVAAEQVHTQGDLLINTIGSPGSRGAQAPMPVILMNSAELDDLLLSSIGTPQTFEAGNATIVATNHPAAGGKTGSFPVATGSFNWQLLGDQLPGGATTLANFVARIPPRIASLADEDAMIAGTKQSTRATADVGVLDFADASAGNWPDENPIPGDATGIWGLLITNQINVATAGTYSFALGTDDGGRVQIDIDRNGFDAADTIIEDLGPHGHTIAYGEATFPAAGAYGIRIVGYNSGGGGNLEVSVALEAGADKTNLADSPGEWEALGTAGAASPVTLAGSSSVTSFVPAGDIEEVTRPFIVLLNGPNDTPPGSVFGGGPFTGFEGRGFFAMSGGNKWAFPDPRTDRILTLRPVNVAGETNVQVTVALAGTFLDFETGDYLDIVAYPTGKSGEEVLLARYSAPDANTKYFVDVTHGNENRLGLEFRDATYDVPPGATDLVLEFRALTTWWNEIVAFDNVRITAGGNGPDPGPLSISRNGANLEISFSGTLETASSITGPWTAVAGNPASPFVIEPGQQTAMAFYRVRQ